MAAAEDNGVDLMALMFAGHHCHAVVPMVLVVWEAMNWALSYRGAGSIVIVIMLL